MVNEEDDDKKATPLPNGKKKLKLYLFLFVIGCFFYFRSSGGKTDGEITDEELERLKEQNAAAIKLAKKKKSSTKDEIEEDSELASSINMIQGGSRTGWHVHLPPLVQKRPARECEIKHIAPQVDDPLTYYSKTKKKGQKKKRRAVSCLLVGSSKKCNAQIMEDFEDRRWKVVKKPKKHPDGYKTWDATFVITDAETLSKLKAAEPASYDQLYYEREGITYLNTLVGAEVIAGSTSEQFHGRKIYAEKHGCKINLLKFLPPTFNSADSKDCSELATLLSKGSSKSMFAVQKDDSDIKMLTGSEMKNGKNPCLEGKPSIVYEAINKPLLLQKKAFSVRSYMLIGSTMPYFVFFRAGYVRRATQDFKSGSKDSYASDRFDKYSLSLAELQTYLAHNKMAGGHYIDTLLVGAMKQITLYVFHAARTKIERRRGSFQLFTLDFAIDEIFHVYLEKVSSVPAFGTSTSHEDYPDLIAEMHDLVMELQEVPVAFEGMVSGDKYGGWELVFSELIESCHKIAYNPCFSFFEFNSRDLRKANTKVGKVHNTANRERHEHDRVKKKAEEQKKAKCKDNRIPYPSAKCDKMAQQQADEKFVRLFNEHEKDYNPNYFELPKIGEVFPWEMV